MRTKFFKAAFIAVILLFNGALTAQNRDSLAIVDGNWSLTPIREGIVLKQIKFSEDNLFNSNQCITVLEIDKKVITKGKDGFSFGVLADKKLVTPENFAKKEGAIIALNGSFFAMGKPYNSVDYVRVDGEELAPNVYLEENERLFHQEGAVIVKKGKLSIEQPKATKKYSILEWERGVKADDILTSGPLLILNGESIELKDISHVNARHPRTALAVKRGGTVCLITIDGRNNEAAGMSLIEVQKLFNWLGAEDLLSLDGGGSTSLYIKGYGVVNHPSDNKKFDSNGARTVANVIALF